LANNKADHRISGFAPKIFLGIDNGDLLRFELGYQNQNYSSINTSNSASLVENFTGTDFIPDYGSTTTKTRYSQNVQISNSFKLKSNQVSLDFKPRILSKNNLEVFGILGLDYYKIKLKTQSNSQARNTENIDYYDNGELLDDLSEIRTLSNSTSQSQSKSTSFIAPAVGLGTQYEITKDFFARAQLRYTYLNKTILSTKLKSTTSIGLGVGYYF
jgi:opacity protein-like surface antigen